RPRRDRRGGPAGAGEQAHRQGRRALPGTGTGTGGDRSETARRHRRGPADRGEGTVNGILGTGAYLPEQEVTNEEMAARFGVTPEWIVGKTGILARRYAAPDEAASDMAVRAAAAALADSGLTPDRIDPIVVSTSTGDHIGPQTSTLVQAAIGARRASCVDVNTACSGFVYALSVARGLLALEPGGHALVIGVDVWSRFIDPA